MLRKISWTISFLFLMLSVSHAQSNKASMLLSGVEMVPDVQTPATGTVEGWVEADTLYVDGEFSDLMSSYFASNIHFGEKGKNGNPIYKLRPDVSDDFRSGSFDPKKNKFPLSEAMLEAFRNGSLYITVASDSNQRGEIRGQINP